MLIILAASFFLSSAVNASGPIHEQYSYDANNRLAKIVYSNDRTINFTYDNNGNLVSATYSSATVVGPVVNNQPAYHPVWEGDSLTLTVKATGSGLTYRWQISTDGGKTWNDMSDSSTINATDTYALNMNSLAAIDAAMYRCKITDDLGNDPVFSNSVNVSVLDPSVTDVWNSTTYLAPGSRFSIYNFEVPAIIADFTSKPKLLKGELVQPVAGKTVTYALTLLATPTALLPKETLSCVWPTPVLLYDKTKLASCYASGFYCANFLALYPQYDKDTYVIIQTSTGTAQYLSRFFTLVPPEITDVKDIGGASISTAAAGGTITVEGNYFGKKAPIAWLEYKVTGKPGVSKLLLKVVPPLKYADEKGVAAKSSMDLDSDTGASEIKVVIPATLPAGLLMGDNNIVIDNGQGLATYTFGIGPP